MLRWYRRLLTLEALSRPINVYICTRFICRLIDKNINLTWRLHTSQLARAMDDDLIRQQRLARFLAARESNQSQSSPRNSGQSQPQPQLSEASAPSKAKPTVARPEQNSKSHTTPEIATRKAHKPEKSPEPQGNIIERVLMVTVDENKKGYIHISDSEFNLDDLDSVLWEAITSSQRPGDGISYLIDCWKRSMDLMRSSSKTDAEILQTALIRYAVICATAAPDDEVYGDLAGSLLKYGASAPWGFVTKIFAAAQEQDMLSELLGIVLEKVLPSGPNGFTTGYRTNFSVLSNLLRISGVPECVLFLPQFHFDKNSGPVHLASNTFLGPLFSVTPLDGPGPLTLFQNINTMTPLQISQTAQDEQLETKVIIDQLFEFVNQLVRAGAGPRRCVLNYFSQVLNVNHKKTAMVVDEHTVNGTGFMLNIAAVLVKFCKPFSHLDGTQISKIRPEYFQFDQSYDISEETRLLADAEHAAKWREKGLTSEAPNFVTEIFFLCAGYLKFGLGAAIQSETRLKRQRDAMQANLESFEQRFGTITNSMRSPIPQVSMFLDRARREVAKYKAALASLACIFRNEDMMHDFTSFASFVLLFAVNRAEPNHAYSLQQLQLPDDNTPDEVFASYPEFMVEAPVEAVTYTMKRLPQLTRKLDTLRLVECVVYFLRRPQTLRNPYLKSRMVEILFYGSVDQPLTTGGSIPGAMVEIFETNKLCLNHLLPALMMIYSDIEHTGRSSQFYDKFNTRELVVHIFKVLWRNSHYRHHMVSLSSSDSDFFVKFVSLLLSDTTYLLEEALNTLLTIRKLQNGINPDATAANPREPDDARTGQEQRQGTDQEHIPASADADPTEPEQESPEQRLERTEQSAKMMLQLSGDNVDLLSTFTKSVPRIFVTAEVVDRVAVMLNYNLAALVGPKCNNLKIRDPHKVGFDPKKMLTELVGVYLNLSEQPEFPYALARDERSFKPENFHKAQSILYKFGLRSSIDLNKLNDLCTRSEEARREEELNEEELGEIPDEFLDPLMYTLMENPVILPTSHVTVDFTTIKAYLLSDPIDPFNRSPLKIEEVTPNVELKQQIEAFKAEKRKNRMQLD